MWTIVDYLYRDAGNNKAFGQLALKGAASAQDERLIRSKLVDDQLFVAEQIAIAPLYAELEQWSDGPTEEDHCWHELGELRMVSDDAQISGLARWGTVRDFVDKIGAVGRWDETLSPNYCLVPSSTLTM